MTRVDFYVLPEADDVGPVLLVCRLCEKAGATGKRVFVHSDDAALLDDIDSALWSFRQNSFLAHERLDASGQCSPLAAIALGEQAPPPSHQDILINIAEAVPTFFSTFERVLEPVFGDDAQRARARGRFGFYRERGYPLQTHKL
ncbi:DNA polymerase III subunit chi [Algiphilus sp.]|uniref:DNA polymerase III subunit chi n=1 Tax=Algiphilus sp. TaxID=1872431 RepID=UPI003B525A2F